MLHSVLRHFLEETILFLWSVPSNAVYLFGENFCYYTSQVKCVSPFSAVIRTINKYNMK